MFDREIEESVEIVAGPAEVWYQLTNFEAYSEWNPFITHAQGQVREGARLTITVDPHFMPALTLRPKIIVAQPQRQLCWRGRSGVPNLFDGEHAFIIESTGINRVRLKQRERFSGILAPGAFGIIESSLRRSFREMNQALRQRAEAAHATREAARAQKHQQPSQPSL